MATDSSQATPPTDAEPLDFLKPRVTARIEKAKEPRKLFNSLRFFLPVVALFVLIALFLWPILNPNRIEKAVLSNIPDIVIQNPHYSGLDTKNQSYSISAVTATRPSGTPNIYDLDKPEGEIQLKNGSWVAGKAQQGRYDQDTHRLWLGGNVQIFHDKGYEFNSSETQVDIGANIAWGDKPVLIHGNFGEIRGKGFRLLEDGNIMVVTGPAQALLNLHSDASSDKPDSTIHQEH